MTYSAEDEDRRIMLNESTATTHGMLDDAIALLKAHQCGGAAQAVRDCKKFIPNVPCAHKKNAAPPSAGTTPSAASVVENGGAVAAPSAQSAVAATKQRDELELIESVLLGFPNCIARSDGLRAVRYLMEAQAKSLQSSAPVALVDKLKLTDRILAGISPTNTPRQIIMYALDIALSAPPAAALMVKEGESLWLIETSELAVKGDPTYPQRHFWTGDPCSQWHHDPLKAARYPMKESAEHAAEAAKLYPRDKYPVCEHLFQCGTSAVSATARTSSETDEQFAKREAQNIVNSADAQYFRWLLKHHSGTDGKRCWIGGVDFTGGDVRDAIDNAINAADSRSDR